MSAPGVATVVVRVYISESKARLKRLLTLLRESGRLSGATVFRGIAGFGSTTPTDADVTELKDPPVVIEFFSAPETVDATVAYIRSMIAPRHIITFDANAR